MNEIPVNGGTRFAESAVIRMPNGMRDAIKAMAKAQNRSMNAQIVHMLSAFPGMPAMPETSLVPTRIKRDASIKAELDATRAALDFAINVSTMTGWAFLQAWYKRDFEQCRKRWPHAPETCYEGLQ